MIEVARRNNNEYFKSFLPAVNSSPAAHRNHLGTTPAAYRPYEEYAFIPRRAEKPLPPEPEERKKDKKWSIGKLFRRKKKGENSGTSSESDEGISTRSLTKKKSKKKKRCPAVNNFDHVVIRDSRRAVSLAKPHVVVNDYADDGVLSDPSAGFISYRAKAQQLYGASKESLNYRDDTSAKTSLETPTKKTRKGRLKARVEALRNSMIGNSSSDEDSLQSSNSSTMIRFRSDDSLMRSRDSSLNKRTKNARNERYIKRLSRDDENQLNKEAELLQQGYTKAEVELLTRTPTSQSSGYGTCKRDQANKPKSEQTYINELTRRPLKSESVSSFPSTQSYPSSINFNAKVNNEHINYSIQYPGRNINRDPVNVKGYREASVDPEKVLSVKFPLGNVTNVKREEKIAPTPPPRDMNRKVATPVSMYYDNNTDRYNHPTVLHGVQNNDLARIMRRSQERSSSYGPNGLRRPISNSEDHIAMQNNEFFHNIQYKSEQPRRPASVSAEPKHYGIYMNTPPWKKRVEPTNIIKPEPVQLRHDYLYFADQSPRSRKPISIKTSENGLDNHYIGDLQNGSNTNENSVRKPKNASEFWKKLDNDERQRRKIHMFGNTRSKSECASPPQYGSNYNIEQLKMYNHDNCNDADIQNRNKVMRSVDTTDSAKIWKATTEYKRALTVEPETNSTPKTHIRHKSDTFITNSNQYPSDDEKTSERRKSTNLDDALNELEAIYNSLGLGDEDLLDRAERRELLTPKLNDNFNDWNGNDNDSVQLRSQPTTPLRSRRSSLPDKQQDDMAFRRMNSLTKEKRNSKDTAQISYMLASPVYVPYASDDDRNSIRGDEPDVVHDDVVYRNITQMNKRLKTLDPQPPFGIPIGPVSPAPQSDYLHATPENNQSRSRFVPRRSPDIVSDDLAYRNLRKDNRHSSVFGSEDYISYHNNNHNSLEYPKYQESPNNVKKKRAVRSLSANIFTMIQKEIDDALTMSKQSPLQKTHSNSDVMRRLRETFENNDNDQERSPRNKVKQRHNTVNLYVNNTHSPNHHITKDDSFIHGDDKYLAKPPSCDKSKSSSPSNKSLQVSKRSSRDEFQHVLSMLAQEAMDTSNKLGVALAELDRNRNCTEKRSDIQSRISDSRTIFLNGLTGKSFDSSTPEIKHVQVHSEIIQPSTHTSEVGIDNISTAKKTEDSLMAISNQLNKVECKLKHSMEKELNFKDESLNFSNYIDESLCQDKKEAQATLVVDTHDKSMPDIVSSNVQNDSMHVSSEEIESNINNRNVTYSPEQELDSKENNKRSLNPFLNVDEKYEEINELDAFKELKDGISNLIAGISHVNEKLFVPKPVNASQNVVKEPTISNLVEVNDKLNQVSQQQQSECKPEVPKRASVNLSIYEEDLEIKKDAADSTEYNSSEELATIFKLDNSNENRDALRTKENCNEIEKNVRDELSSPKLVQSVNQHLRRLSVDNTDDFKPSQSNPLPNNVVPWRTKRQNSQTDNRGDSSQQKQHWHDTGTIMLALSYTVMFSQHLADLDWLTLLGLLLAVVTIVAMLLI